MAARVDAKPRSPTEHDKGVGQRIKARRVALGLAQQDVGDAIGVSFQQIQKYEKGMNRVSAGRLLAIAKLLKIDVSDLLNSGAAVEHESVFRELRRSKQGFALARLFSELSSEGRNDLIKYAKTLSRN